MSELRRQNFVRAFLSSVLGTGASRVLGAVRDMAIAGLLGAGASSDAFWLAYTVPGLFRRFVADEGLTGALIPALAKADQEGVDSKQLANTVLSALLLANAVLLFLGWFGAESLVRLMAPSWDDPEKIAVATNMTRWMMPFVTMVSLVSYFEGLLNHKGHFFIPKLAPGLVSAGIATAAVLLGTRFDEPAYALIVGFLVGGVAHVLVNIPMVIQRWGAVGLGTKFADPRFRSISREIGKVVVIGVFAQLNIIVLRQIGASLQDGTITWYQNAIRIVDLSQGIVAVAIGSALLPGVSRAVAAEDWPKLRQDIVGAMRLAAFLLIPAAGVLLSFGTPITALLFRRGRYTWESVEWTAMLLQLMVPFLLVVAAQQIYKKVFFAMNDRQTLLKVGALGVLVTAVVGFALVEPLGPAALGVALSTATAVQLFLYLVVLHRRLGANLGLG
ncbi:MAG: murein biosynthesis integral membrane protein MurJ, partial [Rhodobacterales bacterium]|nr:murein biosynthesis integral membrane protein MurJ [Rhodobacterales bacterium]